MVKKNMNYKQRWWNSLSEKQKKELGSGKRSHEQNKRDKINFMTLDEYRNYIKTPHRHPKKRNKKYHVKTAHHLYVLRCEHGKYYVGITHNITARLKAHNKGKGALWTKLHRPIEVFSSENIGDISVSDAAKLENKKTIELVALYGLENVRGGGMCQISLKDAEHAYNNHYKRYI